MDLPGAACGALGQARAQIAPGGAKSGKRPEEEHRYQGQQACKEQHRAVQGRELQPGEVPRVEGHERFGPGIGQQHAQGPAQRCQHRTFSQ